MADNQRTKKRQKRSPGSADRPKMLQVACWTCRRRKTRCDGGRPECANCVEKGETCIYETQEGESRGMAMRRENGLLQDRVTQLEAEAEASKASSLSVNSGNSSAGSVFDFVEQQRAENVAAGHTFSRAIDLLHSMATSSDQDASMLLAKLRSGYSWEQLAGEAEAVLRRKNSSPDAFMQPTRSGASSAHPQDIPQDFQQNLDPALQDQGP
ncbi:hypothetical protein CKM354_000805700 [Cercospora kikuchii]|uniref:Zn(2)-C6 fungal-type domain-containing protein n=1 Tax=Cercospora kikuchii TaxID=84275 RepID=A0A9P3CM57_9PEZI|nr:uncharacterized protein CKM354_000805700 [Cercospora kikuchii]GIZ44871.1 hypothetical protein CKM354_000805700 [Cercospora kikuchii]